MGLGIEQAVIFAAFGALAVLCLICARREAHAPAEEETPGSCGPQPVEYVEINDQRR